MKSGLLSTLSLWVTHPLSRTCHNLTSTCTKKTLGIEILKSSEHVRDPSDIESLNNMKFATNFMSDTLNDVLDVQKIEEGMLELELSTFDIREVVNTVFATCAHGVTSKDISLRSVFSPNQPKFIVGDKFRIEHVMHNLLSNAIKFSFPSKPLVVEVGFSMSAAESEGDINECTTTVSVTDMGHGISDENQTKLFKNFVQIRPGNLQKGQGSGLGNNPKAQQFSNPRVSEFNPKFTPRALFVQGHCGTSWRDDFREISHRCGKYIYVYDSIYCQGE